jgi:hypothetical protein
MDLAYDYPNLPTPSASISKIAYITWLLPKNNNVSPTTSPIYDDTTLQNANPSTTSMDDKEHDARYLIPTPTTKNEQQPPVPTCQPNNHHTFNPVTITLKKYTSYLK